MYTPPALDEKAAEIPPPRLGQYGAIPDPIVLRPASDDARDRLEAMQAWNREGRQPRQEGFARSLPQPIVARLGERSADRHSVRVESAVGVGFWGTRATVRGASGVRLHLSGVDLPAGTRFWSYGNEGRPVSFGLEARGPSGDLWTPIAFGETAYLDVEAPSGAKGRFSILEVVEIRPLAAATQPPCGIDAVCVEPARFPAIAQGRKAVAFLEFMDGHQAESCTGTLVNDAAQDGTPYLLTAHHCIATPESASSLQALWDFDAASCGGAAPDPSSLESSVGATLLATGSQSDFTLLQLSSLPSGRSFMGWDSRPSSMPPGTTLYSLSHPVSYVDVDRTPLPMEYSESTVADPNLVGCFAPATTYFYSDLSAGYEWFGSSGSAAMLGGGQVVGQIKGVCSAIIEVCDAPPTLFFGAFSATYPLVARWLDAPSPACVPDPTRLCLGTRFQATAVWQKVDGETGTATGVPLTPDSGYFWFFDPSNVEVIAKIVDGCAFNGHSWVFASGLTNVGVTLTYTDLVTGNQAVYRSSPGSAFPPIQDTSAFATCP